MNKPQRVHFIGICGVAMSAVATALWQKGYRVTGSDSGFFPPVSTHLTNLGIPYYPGFHPEKMIVGDTRARNGDFPGDNGGGAPDFVIVGNAIGTTNPELVYAREHNIPIKSYPEAVAEFIIAKNSIVCAGTWGKTTLTALLTHILKRAGWKPSYMIGGVSADGSPAAVIDSREWSVVEGDEYMTAKWDQRAKFMHYKPTHLLISAVAWDHADVYRTEKSYFKAFENLFALVPKSTEPTGKMGFIVACADTEKLPALLARAKREYISYGKNNSAVYRYENVRQTRDGLLFDITYHGKTYVIQSPLLGSYNAENITGCFAMAREIGIAPGNITDAIKEFHGIKRRLEKRYENKVTIIDDIAHSPEKARSVLETLRSIYSGKIIAVYEPNSGNRTPESKSQYENAFRDADQVIIPRLSKLKIDPKNPEKTFEGEALARMIAESHKNVQYIDNDDELVKTVTENRSEGDVIVFLGSHGWRGMIEETIKKLVM